MIYKIIFWNGKTGTGAGTQDALRDALGTAGFTNFQQTVNRPFYWSPYVTKTLPGKQHTTGTTQSKRNIYEMCAVYRTPAQKDLIYTVYRSEFRETINALQGKERYKTKPAKKK